MKKISWGPWRRLYRIFCGADEPGLFWQKPNSKDPDRNAWPIFAFFLGSRPRRTLFCRFSNTEKHRTAPKKFPQPGWVLPHGAEMAAAACDVGAHGSPGGTSGAAGASFRPLVFPTGIAQFDDLLDGGARTICTLCACMHARGLPWAGANLHSMHPAFRCILHSSRSCIPKCQCDILHSLSQHFACLAPAPHALCIPVFLHCSHRCVSEGRQQDKRSFCIPCSLLGVAPTMHFAPGLTGVFGSCPAVQEYVLVRLRSCALCCRCCPGGWSVRMWTTT